MAGWKRPRTATERAGIHLCSQILQMRTQSNARTSLVALPGRKKAIHTRVRKLRINKEENPCSKHCLASILCQHGRCMNCKVPTPTHELSQNIRVKGGLLTTELSGTTVMFRTSSTVFRMIPYLIERYRIVPVPNFLFQIHSTSRENDSNRS